MTTENETFNEPEPEDYDIPTRLHYYRIRK